ncbi:MAG: NAD(P)-dependent oxidoreductase [Rhizobiaceae bacterium]|nr:NAD(P)-dependent oxidoreductase [Rhizobiaceae bacterium]
MRILVTGGGGFIGAALCGALAARGDHVLAVDIGKSRNLAAVLEAHPDRASYRHGEVTEWAQLAQCFKEFAPDSVVHCAAIVGVTNSEAAPVATLRINVEGSLNVFNLARLFDLRRVVNLSSEEVYGHFEADRIDETHACRPVKLYGISKYTVEQLARDFSESHGLSIVNVRTCWVYGPGLPRPRIPKTLVDAAVAGTPLHLPSGADFRVDHTYIDDCVDGLIRILDAGALPHDTYNIASGEAVSLSEIVAAVKAAVPHADVTVTAGEYRHGGDLRAVRKGALDVTRARRDFGYVPRFDIRKGITAYVEAARKQTQGAQ